MDIHISGFDVILVFAGLVFGLVAWAAAAIGGCYMAVKHRPIWSFISSFFIVEIMIALAMYAGSVR